MYRSALAHRDLRLLLGAMLVSFTGSWAYNVALLAVVYERTESLAWVGATTVVRLVPAILTSPYAGVLADRFERVRVMVASDLLAAASQAALAVVVLASGPVVAMVVLASVTAIAIGPFESASAAVIPQVVEEDDLAAANALRGVLENVIQVAGPALGALLLVVFAPWVVFALDAASYLVSAALLAGMRTRSRPVDVTEGGTAGPLRQLRVGLREIGRSRGVALLVGLSVLASFVYGTDTVLLLGAAEELLGMGPDGYGLLLTGLSIGGIAAVAIVNRLAGSTRLALVLMIGMLVYTLPNIVLAVTSDPAVAVVAQVVRGAGTLVVDVLAVTALQRAVAPDVMARVFGVFWALILGAVALGALTAPLVVAVLGLEGAIVALAVAPALLALLALPELARVDRAAAARTRTLGARVEVLEGAGLFAAAARPVLERLAAEAVEQAVPAGTAVVRGGRCGRRLVRAPRRRGLGHDRGAGAGAGHHRPGRVVRRARAAGGRPPHGHRDHHRAVHAPAHRRRGVPRRAHDGAADGGRAPERAPALRGRPPQRAGLRRRERRRRMSLPAWSLGDPAPPVPGGWPAVLDRAWAFGDRTGRGVRVAVIDSGIDAEHPLVAGGLARAVAVEPGEAPAVVPDDAGDVSGHGTACAGIIRALAPACELTSVRVLGPDLTAGGDLLVEALRWAVRERHDVINLSPVDDQVALRRRAADAGRRGLLQRLAARRVGAQHAGGLVAVALRLRAVGRQPRRPGSGGLLLQPEPARGVLRARARRRGGVGRRVDDPRLGELVRDAAHGRHGGPRARRAPGAAHLPGQDGAPSERHQRRERG